MFYCFQVLIFPVYIFQYIDFSSIYCTSGSVLKLNTTCMAEHGNHDCFCEGGSRASHDLFCFHKDDPDGGGEKGVGVEINPEETIYRSVL